MFMSAGVSRLVLLCPAIPVLYIDDPGDADCMRLQSSLLQCPQCITKALTGAYWFAVQPSQVAVLYTSDYGYSDRLSQTLAKGITKAGVKTEMVDVLSVDPQVRGASMLHFTELFTYLHQQWLASSTKCAA
jgi:hypothetical protein